MNWYGFLKFAQIWQTKTDTDFSFVDQLEALYELEYKYSMLKNKPFQGMPQRKENILSQLKQRLGKLALEVREPILETFQDWLSAHPLSDPSAWGKHKTDNALYRYESSVENIVEDILYEYERSLNVILPLETIFQKLIQDIVNNISNFPQFKNFLEVLFADYKENLKYDLESSGHEEFGKMFGQTFNTPEEGEAFIEKLTIDDIGIDDVMTYSGINDLEPFIRKLGYEGDLVDGVLAEMYEKIVFPIWYSHWAERGIDKTKENIENIYNNLLKANTDNIDNFIACINIALNAAHQTGSMLEYLQEYIEQNPDDYNTYGDDLNLKETFEYLSTEMDTAKWDKELQEIGVKI